MVLRAGRWQSGVEIYRGGHSIVYSFQSLQRRQTQWVRDSLHQHKGVRPRGLRWNEGMKVKHSHGRPRRAPDAAVEEVLRGVSPKALRAHVKMLAFPRHYVAEKRANRR